MASSGARQRSPAKGVRMIIGVWQRPCRPRLLVEGLEEELFIQPWQVAVGGDGEQLVGEVHQDAVVACGMVGEGGFELGGHEAGVAGGFEQVVNARVTDRGMCP
jgi:hypothetical protein